MTKQLGEYTVQQLRPHPDRLAEFMPLWDARNIAIEQGDEDEARRISALMAPLQFQVGEVETYPNIVTTVGKNLTLDTILGNTAAGIVRMGLKGTGTAVIGDTQASHAGWLEQGLANAPVYTGNRPTPTFSAASGAVKATSAAVAFAITSTGTVFGSFINIGGSATKDDTTGTLFSAGDFTGGSRAVVNLDTLNVTYQLTAT